MTAPALDLDIATPAWAAPLLQPARYKGARGGRGGGKSHFFAEMAVEQMVCDPDLRFACIREVQRSLGESAKELVEAKIRKLGVGHLFDVQRQRILRVGGNGLMIFEGMQNHTADSIKSLEGFGRAWVEEAQRISPRSLELLLPTIRAEGSEIWFSWNPRKAGDAVEAFFASNPPDSILVEVGYLDNPFRTEVIEREAERLKAADPEAYAHVWLGGYYLGEKGRVYHAFANAPWPAGNIDADVRDGGGELLVGMDFNVEPMTAVVAVRAVDECHVIDAIELEVGNTDAMAVELKRRYPGRHIVVCPDPAGSQRRTSAQVGQTDHTILRAHGFVIRAPRAAPPVVDRENNANAMYHDALTDRRRVKISPRAGALISALGGLSYKNGRRDKDSHYDHICDAADYLLWQEFNVLTPAPGNFRLVY